MDVTLLHNPKAGAEEHAKKDLVKELERAGHKVVMNLSTKKKGLARALEEPTDVVVVAGGDGTVRKVARRLIGRNMPLAILPLGTANNIARSLRLPKDPLKMIHALARARAMKFDAGIARGPWGDEPFFEAAGAGLFPSTVSDLHAKAERGVAEALDAEEPEDPAEGLEAALRFLKQMLGRFRGREFALTLDSCELSGRYLLVEAMNIPRIGPAVELAPQADPGDGLLDVVLVAEDQRHDLRRHLAENWRKRKGGIFTVHRARQVQLCCAHMDFHLDDEVWPGDAKDKPQARKLMNQEIRLEIAVFPGALRVLVPE